MTRHWTVEYGLTNVLGIAAVALAGWFGGWAWTLPCLFVLLEVRRNGGQAEAMLAALAPGLGWLALFAWNGDRRLFFPYSMQYAIHLACLERMRGPSRAVAGGAGIIGVFTAIRLAQAATAPVLLVELVVAAALLGTALAVHGAESQSAGRRAAVAGVGSLLAFAALAL